jgi:hypothetical protein
MVFSLELKGEKYYFGVSFNPEKARALFSVF